MEKYWCPENLPYVRDRIVESYFAASAICSEPKYSLARVFLAKMIQMITILDDTFDTHGTYEELQIFTEAVERYLNPTHGRVNVFWA